MAGGGASVVYSDAIAAHGFADELANYGEYSGAPTEGQTYEYSKTISKFPLTRLSILSECIFFSRPYHSWHA